MRPLSKLSSSPLSYLGDSPSAVAPPGISPFHRTSLFSVFAFYYTATRCCRPYYFVLHSSVNHTASANAVVSQPSLCSYGSTVFQDVNERGLSFTTGSECKGSHFFPISKFFLQIFSLFFNLFFKLLKINKLQACIF